MQIQIVSLEIKAFKGIRDLRLALDGRSADLYGMNGTGKTSVYDAYLWALFGKDSAGAAKFDVKPLNEDGSPRTGADTEVEVMLLVDGKETKLRRVLHEKWKAAPGKAEPVYMGDETLCYIDDVPAALEKEYKPFVASLIGDEEQFKLLSIHGYFMGIPWEQRRRYLVDAAGGNAEAELLNRPEFAALPDILQGKSPEDAKKRLADQLKRVQEELNAIPGRLDELQRMYDPPTSHSLQLADDMIAAHKKELEDVNKQLDGTEDVFAKAAELGRKVRTLNEKIELRKAELDRPIREAAQAFEERLKNARERKKSLSAEAKRFEDDLMSIDFELGTLKTERERLLAEYYTIKDEPYIPQAIETKCPVCGQDLPLHQVEQAKKKAESAFFNTQQRRLNDKISEGEPKTSRINRLEEERKGIQESLDKKRVFIAVVDEDIKVLEAEDALPKPQHYQYEQDEKYMQLMGELQKLREEMEAPRDTGLRNQLLTRRDQIIDTIAEWKKTYAKRDSAEAVKGRMNTLEKRREELGQDVIRITGQLADLQEYTAACCSAMEDRINAMFHEIQWQLFEPLKNGGYRACCNATLHGVNYATNLNNGARINAGIEAIRVLSRSLGVTVPLFVDNAEAVNNLTYAPGQMIRLHVSNDTKLTMVLEG